MRISIIDGRIVGYNSVNEQAEIWGVTPGAIRQMIKRGQINSEDYICLLGDTPNHNIYYFAVGLEKPTRKTKCGKERRHK